MKKQNAFILAAAMMALTFITSCKTGKSAQSSMQGKEEKLADALLWEITGEGIAKPSYIFGTIHMINQNDYFLPKGTLSAIEDSEQMIFEIDMAEMTDMSALMGVMGKIFMKDNISLKDLLDDTEYALVKAHFEKIGMPLAFLERIKPMFLSALAYGDMDPQGLQNGAIKSYEIEFYQLAKDKSMETGGLETIDFQISVFDSIPYEAQAKMLVETIKTSSSDNDEFKIMSDMYKAQKINDMISMMSAEGSDIADYQDILLTTRNVNWIPQIIEQAKSKQTFFAVGAGHLAGSTGVLNLLKKQGIKIRPLSI